MKVALIFPGWGISYGIYDELDIGEYEKIIVDLGNENIAAALTQQEDVEAIAVGWSMGAINLMKNIERLKLRKTILISPAFSFLDTQPEIVVKKMIKDLKRNKDTVLKRFIEMNFSKSEFAERFITKYGIDSGADIEKLTKGLEFLITENVERQYDDYNGEILAVYGTEDIIINPEVSKKCINKLNNKKWVEYRCGHNVIFEKREEVNELLRGYIDDRESNSRKEFF